MIVEVLETENNKLINVHHFKNSKDFYEFIEEYEDTYKTKIKEENIPDVFEFLSLPIEFKITWEDDNNEGGLFIKEIDPKVDESVDVVCEFGGFYESIHMQIIEGSIESQFMDDSGELPEDFCWDNVNLVELEKKYAKVFVEELIPKKIIQEFYEEYGLKIPEDLLKIEFKELISPQFYNYSTDVIKSRLTASVANFLIELFSKNEYFDNYVKEWVEEHENSNYTYGDIIANKDNMFLEFILMYVADILSDNMYDDILDTGETYYEYIENEISFDIQYNTENS